MPPCSPRSSPKTVIKALAGALVALATSSAALADSCSIGAGLCPQMVQVPGGIYTMGSSAGGEATERPAHRVALKNFRISSTPVTFDQWDACVKAGGCINGPAVANDFGAGRGQRPLSYVTYADAVAYAAWLGAQLHGHFRLPSEAEYEYAARAGSTTTYPWGDKPDAARVASRAGPVGMNPPNAFGLYDMTGNIAEITLDCWHENYDGAPVDGSAWQAGCQSTPGAGLLLTIRGAFLKNDAITDVRPATRQPFGAVQRSQMVGFRVVQDD